MGNQLSDPRDVKFALYEQLGLEELTRLGPFKTFDQGTFDLVLAEARKVAEEAFLPLAKEGDRIGCTYDKGKVSVPHPFQAAYRLFCEGGWITMADPEEVGGQGLPQLLSCAALELFTGANAALGVYAMLCHGVGKLIETFGTEHQKSLFLEKVYSGEWGGTMALTEPTAGSDVGALRTRATRSDDGTYSICGSKIFITGAEQDLTPNIVHAVLARVEGAPAGTAGISLFLVPKFRVRPDGSLGEANDVRCTGIEEKLGLHGSATCAVSFGDNGRCQGLLLGQENRGMHAMFHMMNEERLNVGLQSLGHASTAYLYALDYARERIQGKDLLQMMNPEARSVSLTRHPDVRRMLLWMKAHVEGIRSLNYYVARCMDLARAAENEEEKARSQDVVELLTRICKAYCSERAFEVCVQAMQVYGGYGYCSEYPIEQILRDCKIASIYEGANGVQAMDLLGRKLGTRKGEVFKNFIGTILGTVERAEGVTGLEGVAAAVRRAALELGDTALHLSKMAMSPDATAIAFANAHPFLEAMGDVTLGWLLLWRALVAGPKLERLLGDGSLEKAERTRRLKESPEASFYSGQIMTAEYFATSVLPLTVGRLKAVKLGGGPVVEIAEGSFGG